MMFAPVGGRCGRRRLQLLPTGLLAALALGAAEPVEVSDAARGESKMQPMVLLDQVDFAQRVAKAPAADGKVEDWIVLFCDDAVLSCRHVTESYQKLGVIWQGMSLMPSSVHFAQVNCSVTPSICADQGAQAVPAAIHYRDGARRGSWSMERDRRQSIVWQLVAWVKQEVAPPAPAAPAAAGSAPALPLRGPGTGSSRYTFLPHLPLFAHMDEEEVVMGYCLIVVAIAAVAFVLVEGFELWPYVYPAKWRLG